MLKPIYESYNCLEDFETSMQRKKDVIKNSITSAINMIENHFGIELEKTIIENEDSVIIEGAAKFGSKSEYKFTVSKWFDSKLVFNKLSFKSSNSLMVSGCSKNIFTLSLNEDFTIESLEYTSAFKNKNGHLGSIELTFNNSLSLINMVVQVSQINARHEYLIDIAKKGEMLSSFDDEAFFLSMALNKNDSTYELLPECYVESVYDFKSKDLIDRLKVFEMLRC